MKKFIVITIFLACLTIIFQFKQLGQSRRLGELWQTKPSARQALSPRYRPKIPPVAIEERPSKNAKEMKKGEWKTKLKSDLSRFQDRSVRVDIKKVRENQKVVKVRVKYTLPSGATSSFHALVNRHTGEIMRTGNKAIHENKGRRGFKLTPNGTL